MRIPRHLYIKGHQWIIKRAKRLKDATGITEPDKKIIKLSTELTGAGLEWVFWHEICHGILEESGVTRNTGGITPLQEELICDAFADFMTTSINATVKRGKR